MRRLGEIGVNSREAKLVLNNEPGLGGAWFVYVALAPVSILKELFDDGIIGDRSSQ